MVISLDSRSMESLCIQLQNCHWQREISVRDKRLATCNPGSTAHHNFKCTNLKKQTSNNSVTFICSAATKCVPESRITESIHGTADLCWNADGLRKGSTSTFWKSVQRSHRTNTGRASFWKRSLIIKHNMRLSSCHAFHMKEFVVAKDIRGIGVIWLMSWIIWLFYEVGCGFDSRRIRQVVCLTVHCMLVCCLVSCSLQIQKKAILRTLNVLMVSEYTSECWVRLKAFH